MKSSSCTSTDILTEMNNGIQIVMCNILLSSAQLGFLKCVCNTKSDDSRVFLLIGKHNHGIKVTFALRRCYGAEVVLDSLIVSTLPVAFINQVAVLLKCITKEQKRISQVLMSWLSNMSIFHSFFS